MSEDSTQPAKHAPGPWKVWLPDSYGAIHVVRAQNLAICRIMTDFSADADANLIAAAPETLAALREARNAFAGRIHHMTWHPDDMRLVALKEWDAAIAKAEGR